MLQMLLLHGAAVDDADPDLQCTSLHHAARYGGGSGTYGGCSLTVPAGDVRCVELLIEHGADVNAATRR